jgi:hypothetical protein
MQKDIIADLVQPIIKNGEIETIQNEENIEFDNYCSHYLPNHHALLQDVKSKSYSGKNLIRGLNLRSNSTKSKDNSFFGCSCLDIFFYP